MNRRKKKLYISAAALLLLLVVLIIILIHAVRHRDPMSDEEPSPEPTEEATAIPRPSRKPLPLVTPPLVQPSVLPEPPAPAITPPAITAVDPASGSDIILRPVKPATNTDIDAPT